MREREGYLVGFCVGLFIFTWYLRDRSWGWHFWGVNICLGGQVGATFAFLAMSAMVIIRSVYTCKTVEGGNKWDLNLSFIFPSGFTCSYLAMCFLLLLVPSSVWTQTNTCRRLKRCGAFLVLRLVCLSVPCCDFSSRELAKNADLLVPDCMYVPVPKIVVRACG